MSIDYAENMFEAMKIIADKQVKNTSFDQTIVATVVDASKAKDGIYTVFNGNTNFVAYSSEIGYKKDDSVMVTIPQGDYNNQKVIISKAVNNDNNEDSPLVYHSPLENFVDLSGNLISNIETEKIGLLANGNNYVWNENTEFLKALNVSNPQTPPKIIEQAKEIELNTGYTHIAVKAEFSTFLGIYDIVKGNFGLALVVSFKKPIKLSNDTNNKKQVFLLDSSSFLGNVYGSTIPRTQEILFDISEYEGNPVEQIDLYAYQRNNFKDINNNRLIYSKSNFHDEADNIFIKDCYVGLGVMNDEIATDIAKLYTASELYSQSNDTKNIYLSWIHKNLENNSASLIYNDNFPEGYIIKWYKYVLGKLSPDNFAGPNWEEIKTEISTAMNISFSPNPNNQRELIKVIIIKDGSKIAVSPALELFNSKKIIDPDIVNLLDVQSDALGIRINDGGEQGNYSFYDRAGKLMGDNSEKILTAVFDPNESVLEYKGQLEECTFTKWIFPADGMIVPIYNNQVIDKDFFKDVSQTNIQGEPTKQIDQRENNTITTATYNASKKIIYIQSNIKDNTSIKYKLKDSLLYPGTRDYIYLEVEKDNIKYTASTSMFFNTFGTSGSQYNIIIEWDQQESPVFDISKDNVLTGIIKLQDKNWQTVTLNNEASFSGDWIKGGSDSLQIEIKPKTNKISIKKGEKPVDMNQLYILQITLTNFGDYKLKAYFPIALKNNLANYYSFEGPDIVRYASDGTINFDQKPYNLKNKYNENTNDFSWKIIGQNHKGLPGLDTKLNMLLPYPIYFSDLPICGVQAIKNDNNIIVWTQPLYIYRDNYPSTTLNEWNGQEIKLHQDEGVILARGMAVGRKAIGKNNENTFSGVVIGDFSETVTDQSITKHTGIYGLHQGSMSYAFKDDGTAFIGKNGIGRIEFDGNQGIIKSANFVEATNNQSGKGMKIDLTNNILELYSPTEETDQNNNIVNYQLKLSSIGTETKPFIQVSRKVDSVESSCETLFNQYENAYNTLKNLITESFLNLTILDKKFIQINKISEYGNEQSISDITNVLSSDVMNSNNWTQFSDLIYQSYLAIQDIKDDKSNYFDEIGGIRGSSNGLWRSFGYLKSRCKKLKGVELTYFKHKYNALKEQYDTDHNNAEKIDEFLRYYIDKYEIPQKITYNEGQEEKENYEYDDNGHIITFNFYEENILNNESKVNTFTEDNYFLYNFEYKVKTDNNDIVEQNITSAYENFKFQFLSSEEHDNIKTDTYILRGFILPDIQKNESTNPDLRIGDGSSRVGNISYPKQEIKKDTPYDIILQIDFEFNKDDNKYEIVQGNLQANPTSSESLFGIYFIKDQIEKEYDNIQKIFSTITKTNQNKWIVVEEIKNAIIEVTNYVKEIQELAKSSEIFFEKKDVTYHQKNSQNAITQELQFISEITYDLHLDELKNFVRQSLLNGEKGFSFYVKEWENDLIKIVKKGGYMTSRNYRPTILQSDETPRRPTDNQDSSSDDWRQGMKGFIIDLTNDRFVLGNNSRIEGVQTQYYPGQTDVSHRYFYIGTGAKFQYSSYYAKDVLSENSKDDTSYFIKAEQGFHNSLSNLQNIFYVRWDGLTYCYKLRVQESFYFGPNLVKTYSRDNLPAYVLGYN